MTRRRRPGDGMRMPQPLAGDIGAAAGPDLGPLRRVAAAWPDAVGEQLARVARPARLTRDGALVVHAADASWMHAIALEERRILRRLAEALGGDAPTALKVEVGDVAPPPEATATAPPEPPGEEAVRRAGELTAEVADPRLRAALERLIAQSLQRRKTQ